MDRAIVQPGQIPLDTDVLRSGQFGMVGNAKTNEALLGTSACVSGFTLTPTAPASLSAALGPGVVFQQANLEATPFGSLPADTHTIVKQGILLDPANVTFTPPTTVGYSQVFLVEVQYADGDTGAVVRPYYNAANPAVQFNGPGGAGTADNTTRRGTAAYQIKAGIAATSGTQVTPSPDAGWLGLFAVTLAQGATTVTAGNIALYSPSAFIPATLPAIPSGVQNGQWVFGTASGVNTYTASLFSTNAYPFALTRGMEILVYIPPANANTTTTPTLNANGSGAKSIVRQGGGAVAAGDVSGFVPLVYDNTNWCINGLVPGDVVNTVANTPSITQGRLLNTQIFDTAGSTPYAPSSSSVKSIRVTVTGGGGTGNGLTAVGSGYFAVAGGGGGGGTAISILTLATAGVIGATITVGGTGQTSSFGSFLSATGGSNSSGSAPVANGTSAVQSGGNAGQGTGGNIGNYVGQGAGYGTGTSSTNMVGGYGGGTEWGYGPNGATGSGGDGSPGVTPGSGGSGAAGSTTARASGQGKSGRVYIEEFS